MIGAVRLRDQGGDKRVDIPATEARDPEVPSGSNCQLSLWKELHEQLWIDRVFYNLGWCCAFNKYIWQEKVTHGSLAGLNFKGSERVARRVFEDGMTQTRIA